MHDLVSVTKNQSRPAGNKGSQPFAATGASSLLTFCFYQVKSWGSSTSWPLHHLFEETYNSGWAHFTHQPAVLAQRNPEESAGLKHSQIITNCGLCHFKIWTKWRQHHTGVTKKKKKHDPRLHLYHVVMLMFSFPANNWQKPKGHCRPKIIKCVEGFCRGAKMITAQRKWFYLRDNGLALEEDSTSNTKHFVTLIYTFPLLHFYVF